VRVELLYEVPAVWLREPILLLTWSVVVLAVVGVGRAMGLPLLFWHERKNHSFWAGLAATLLTAEVFFVIYLIHSWGEPYLPDLPAHLIGGAVLWTIVVAIGAWRLLRPAGVGVTARPRAVVDHRLGHLMSMKVSPWPFVGGMAVAAAFVALLVLVDRRLFGGDPSSEHLHIMAAAVAGGVLLAFILARRYATPAIGLSMLIALFAALYGFITFRTGARGLTLVAAILMWAIAGRNRYRLRLDHLERRYPKGNASGLPYPPKPVASLHRPLLLDRLMADGDPGAWPGANPNGKRPVVLVCTSGGGIRAAVWTAGVLGSLDGKPGFRQATRMITGASGGMVGAATWMAWLASDTERPPTDVKALTGAVAMDSLTATARRLFFHDIPMSFWPGTNRTDRGRALERAWRHNVAAALHCHMDVPLTTLRDGEDQGRWPSLVFTPMLVEDGRRLILSNLRLDSVLVNQADWLDADGADTSVSSVTAYHAAALFPDDWPTFPLSTAARLSASFPYVSGAVVLPTTPRRRVVDAGYYDNYGMDLTCGWLREAVTRQRAWLAAHVSEVLVVQIRDNVSHLSINPESETERQRTASNDDGSAIGRGLEGISSPPEGLLAARDSVSLFRSDTQLEAVTRLYADVAPIRTTVFEFKGEASLSWYLTADEKHEIHHQLTTKKVRDKMDDIGGWLARQPH